MAAGEANSANSSEDVARNEFRNRLFKALTRGVASQSEWDTFENCGIEIILGQNEKDAFCLWIGFRNKGNSTINCSFYLPKGLLEKYVARSLNFYDDSGQKHSFIQTMMGTPRNPEREPRVIKPGGWCWFELKKPLHGGRIEFNPGYFRLVSGTTYTLQFEYLCIKSNTIKWTVP